MPLPYIQLLRFSRAYVNPTTYVFRWTWAPTEEGAHSTSLGVETFERLLEERIKNDNSAPDVGTVNCVLI